MERKIRGIYLLMLGLVLCLAACQTKEKQIGDIAEYAEATLFCDVSFWSSPLWSLEEGTITGDITKATGLALNIMIPSQGADMQLKLMLVNNEMPDIISVTDKTTISQLISSGKVWKLDEFLAMYKPDSHILIDFPEDIKRELLKRDGAWYVLPSHLNSVDAREKWKANEYMEDFVAYNDNNAIIWNKMLLNQTGLQIEQLQTEEQILAAFNKVKNMELEINGELVIPLLLDGKSYQDPTLKYLEGTFGSEWVDENGNYKDILLQPQTKNALRFLNTSMRNSYAEPEQLIMETEEIQELISSGRVLCFIGNIANIGADFNDWISSGVIFSTDGNIPVMGKNLRASTGWISTFISKECKNPKEIALFLDYMTSEEGMLFWNYGYEGKDYYVGEDGLNYRTQTGMEAVKEYKQTGMGAWWMFGNMAWDRSVASQSENDLRVNAAMTAYGRNAVLYDSSLLIMPANLISTESEEGQIEKEIAKWKTSQITKVILAVSEEDFEQKYDQFIQGLYDIGIKQLDIIKNTGYRQNCLEYGKNIQKVN